MPDAKPAVLVIDDDPDLRASVGRLLRSVGLETQLFASISDFLKSDPPDGPTCLVLDVRLPGQSGLDLQRELAAANRELPFTTAEIVPLRRRKPLPECVYPKIRKAAE
jgi:FixJ family two-component response regulator